MFRYILLLFSYFIIINHVSGDYLTNWTSVYHDPYHSSCGASITPIVNDLEWTMWQRLDNSSLDYNIVILSDQSYILPTYNEQTNDYTLSRYTYNTTLISSFYSDIRFSANSSLSLLIIDTNKLVIYDNNQFILSLLNINTGNAIWSIDSTNCGGVKTASPPQYIYEKLYMLCENDTIVLYGLKDGAVESVIQLPVETVGHYRVVLSSGIDSGHPLVLVDYDLGTVYVMANDSSYTNFTLNEGDSLVRAERAVVTRYDNFIAMLVCSSNTSSIQLQIYGLLNLHQMRAVTLFDDQDQQLVCSNIQFSALLSNPKEFVVTLSFNYDDKVVSYLGVLTTPYYNIRWSLSKQVVSILDITLSGESSFYICSPDAIYLVDTSHATVKTLAFQANDNQTGLAYACKLSNAQSAIMAITSNLYDSNNNNETNKLEQNVILKISDSKCIELCSQNTTCTTDSCQCMIDYYPAGECTVYCNADDTCSGHGDCQDDGSCLCFDGTGYFGDDCSQCKSGYFGPHCNFHMVWKITIIAGCISFVVTSSICIFACATSPEFRKKLRKCCCCHCLRPIKCPKLPSSFKKCTKKQDNIENESLIANYDL